MGGGWEGSCRTECDWKISLALMATIILHEMKILKHL